MLQQQRDFIYLFKYARSLQLLLFLILCSVCTLRVVFVCVLRLFKQLPEN